MIQQTINGEEVSIIRFKDRYLVIKGSDMYFTKEKPYTDQEIKDIENELNKVRNEIHNVRNQMNTNEYK